VSGAPISEDGSADAVIDTVDIVELIVRDEVWPFAEANRTAITSAFVRLQRDKPDLWNGQVLLFRDCRIVRGVLRGDAFVTDYASFLAWRQWPDADPTVRNLFACAAVEGSDGRFLLGEMGSGTVNAGEIYFPCGTPDPDDIKDGRVDVEFSARRELQEETGIDPAALAAEPYWHVVRTGMLIALIRRMRAAQPAATLHAAAMAYLRREPQPELADLVVVGSRAEIGSRIAPFAAAFLRSLLR
jgi:8-oxo-dGTP pyrophosphatase MutT (NUDIX family)